ncbi:MAG: aspartate kinase [Ignavibacteriales bacterium]|nr:aspartate kinase [Ignavibacteriales bacterium]
MSIIVQKYGGSSVSDVDKLKKIASMVAAVKHQGLDVVVVVSAMGKTTNQLIDMAKSFSASPDKRELDMLLSTGERITMAMLCIALNDLGIKAISLTGSQSGIITNDRYNDARVIEIRPFRVQDELAKGKVVVIGGFQGVSYRRDITTLGRGGSDTSAVAMAAALNAERCEIYSDVDGVYSADPNVVKDAKHLPELSYQQIQEMSEAGAKVLNAQAIQFAKESKIAIYARSTFDDRKETVIRKLESDNKNDVIGIVHEQDIIRVTIKFDETINSTNEISVLISQLDFPIKEFNYLKDETLNISKYSFLISKSNIHNWKNIEAHLNKTFGDRISIDEHLAAVSLIGEGFSRESRIIVETLKLLSENNISIFGVSTTSFRISLLINKDLLNKTIQLLHEHWVK